MKAILFNLLTLISLTVFSQHNINGSISGLENTEIYLLRIEGDNRKITDTTHTDESGSFVFTLERDFPIGLYAVVAGPEQMIELIYNNEDIRFVTNGSGPESTVQIIESVENLIYYDYLSLKGMNLYKLDILKPVLQDFPRDDDFYIEALAKAKQLQREVIQRTDELIKENPGTLVSHFIAVDKPVFAEPELDEELQRQWVLTHFFDDTEFTDTLLVRSNILSSKIISYIGLYQEPGLTREKMEEKLLVAVDSVLEMAFVDQKMYEFVMGFLMNGFEAIGFEKGLQHLAEKNMLEDLCVNTERKSALEHRLEIIKKLAEGQPAPNFKTVDLKGDTINLSEIDAQYTVLLFWASWCPHCDEMIPKLVELYKQNLQRNFEVVAVSIDEVKEDLEKAIHEKEMDWINIGELKGWDGPIVEEYGIAATPTLFVLDADKKIIGKPTNMEGLKKLLN